MAASVQEGSGEITHEESNDAIFQNLPSLSATLTALNDEESEDVSDTDLEIDKASPKDIRMECGVKNLYEGPPKCSCCTNWIEEYPEDFKETIEETKDSKRHALLVRHKKSHRERGAMQVYQIVVQSPLLKAFLETALKDYPPTTVGLKDLEFSQPFVAFFHNWDRIKQGAKHHDDEETLSHIRLLFRMLKKELKTTISTYKDLISHSVMTFDFLWTLFKPGDMVHQRYVRNCRMYQVERFEYDVTRGKKTFDLKCRYIDWDGAKLGSDTCWIRTKDFDGPKLISELEICPNRFVENFEQIEQRIQARSEKFLSLRGNHYRSYQGIATRPEDSSFFFMDEQRLYVHGRIVIDAEAYFQYNTDSQISLSSELMGQSPVGSYKSARERKHYVHIDDDADSTDKHSIAESVDSGTISLTKEQLLVCVPFIRGYSLNSKKWAIFDIDKISEINWNEDAFTNLMIPRPCKELILSFVESQLSNHDGFDDFIEGKGQGIIILLSGDPGVGKTLTAESVAEEMRRPLYSVTAGELGSNLQSVEKSLAKVLDLAARWKSVLLLDEADVFLEQRSSSDLERNKLVTVFLRTLEYYKGILFITTNRISSFDKAFQSRIHLSLNYPGLSKATQKDIWKNFITRSSSQEVRFTEDDLKHLTERQMNGREIKNAVKMASLLASRYKEPLSVSHVKEVLKVVFKDFWDESIE